MGGWVLTTQHLCLALPLILLVVGVLAYRAVSHHLAEYADTEIRRIRLGELTEEDGWPPGAYQRRRAWRHDQANAARKESE